MAVARRPKRKFGASQKERIFLACLPDAETAARIHATAAALKRDNNLTGTLILPEHLHVTLFHLGDWAALPEEVVRLAKDAAAQVAAPPFEVSFKRTESFRNRTGTYPFVLTGDASQWRELHATLAASLKRIGLAAATQGDFEPHVTLLYDPVRLKPSAIAPVSWTVHDFVLVHSRLGKTTHGHLARWPLEN
ncbi:MAG TPA: 2'-5' RNA ligase family protein [Rhizomicrobium sp.]|jgi:2'-5' RNA ligase|nr:2'-5' RNA ligase family protein [Rhizomicrobium sp.]